MEKITFEDYIKNPTGGKTHMVGQRDMARAVYNDKYNKMLLRCAGHINYLLFKERDPKKENTRFIIYIQMPSESTEKLYYDVVVEFTAVDDAKRRINNLDAYHVRFFSNDPNFVYTYAYAFNKKKLIIPELISKIGEKALKEAPKHTNPNILSGYVKSLYFAYLFMKNKGLFNKLMWQNAASIEDMHKFFVKYIINTDKKLMYVQHYIQVANAKKRGDSTRVSESDEKGLEKASKSVITKAKLIKAVDHVNKENMRIKKKGMITKIQPIGRK